MKANLDNEKYREFNDIVDRLKKEKNVIIDHAVQYEIDGTFTIELLGETNLNNLDDLVSTLNS